MGIDLSNKMSRNIKVLNVLLDDRIGGAQVRILSIARDLKKKGVEYLLTMPYGNGWSFEYARREGITVYQCGLGTPHFIRDIRSTFANVRYLINFIPSVLSLIRIIEKEDIDIVHLNGLLSLQGALAALLTRKKVVWHLYGTLYPEFLIRILRPFIRLTADRVINISKGTREYYLRGTGIADIIIHEPVDIRVFDPDVINESQRSALKKELGVAKDDFVIGSVGNITWVKGYENLIEAMSVLKKKNNRMKLLIVGKILKTQMGYYKRLKGLTSSFGLEENIYFTGMREDIPNILSIIDLFVLPSLAEGTPISILEAMAMEIPVIASRVGGIPELIIDGVTGILIKSAAPSEIVEAVIHLFERPYKRRNMGKMARRVVREDFSLEGCVFSHEKLYKNFKKRLEF